LVLTWLLFSALYISNYIVVQVADGKTFSSIDKIPYNRVGVLLGTSKYRKKKIHNLYFDYRIEAASALFHAGKIDFIIVSGDNRKEDYDEPEQMMVDLMALGVPEQKIFKDKAGIRTLDSVIRAKKVFGLNKFTIISQKFHNERAIYIAEKNGLDVIGFNAQDVTKSYGFKTNLREKMARVKVVLDIIFGIQPKVLEKQVVVE
jgi:SanA protein